MPIAAVPRYLGQNYKDFQQASPGLRFGMYLCIWDDNALRVVQVKKNEIIGNACGLTQDDKDAMHAWQQRQQRQARPLLEQGLLAEFFAESVAPFATGLGNEHPTENGFAFLWPYGLPYLSGSGVKGVLRQAARELDWPQDEREALFGSEPPDDDQQANLRRGALSFWDVVPMLEGNALRVEVMTPHQSHYYQSRPGQQERNAGSNSPHDSGSPNPIFFLSVPPGSKFVFRVTCDPQYLSPGLRADNLWQQRLRQAFEHAFDWLGFGAKTAVGYGALRFDEQAQQKAQAELQQAQRQKQLASLTPAQRAIEEYAQYMAKRQQEIRGRKTLVGQQDYQRTQALAQQAQSPDWSPEEKRAAADAIEQWAPQIIQLELRELRKRLNLSALRT